MRRLPLLALACALLTAMPAAASGAERHPPTRVRAATELPRPKPCAGCWQPALETSWQWQLQYAVDTSVGVAMYDVDGFEATKALVSALHADGRAAICYVSAGSWEEWRPDAGRFPASVLGRSNGWPGERWLDVRRTRALRPIMEARLDMCARKGFDGVEFDNVDGYQKRTGFPLTARDQLRYNAMLANQAHRRGLSAALKNDLGQVRKLLPYFDYALNEQCFQYGECWKLTPFVDAGKAVFGVEYRLVTDEFCARANTRNFNFLKKRRGLGPWRIACR